MDFPSVAANAPINSDSPAPPLTTYGGLFTLRCFLLVSVALCPPPSGVSPYWSRQRTTLKLQEMLLSLYWSYFWFSLSSSSVRTSGVSVLQRNSAEPDDDNIPQAETLCTLRRMLFLVLENRFRHGWAVTFPSIVEGERCSRFLSFFFYSFNIYGPFDATQG